MILKNASTVLCVRSECPVDAIVSEDDLTDEQRDFLEINEKYSAKWPVITSMKDAPEDADDWKDVKDKRTITLKPDPRIKSD